MGGNIVLGLIRTAAILALCVIGFLAVRQYDAFETRVLEVKSVAEDARTKAAENAEALKRIERALASGIRVDGGGDGGKPSPSDDPREAEFWDTPDNVLANPNNEPTPPDSAKRGGTLNFYITSNPSSLNGHVNNDADLSDRVEAYVYHKLANRSKRNPDAFIGELANRVTISDDGRVFTIYIRKGLVWHPAALDAEERRGAYAWLAKMGSPEVTAHDVKFTFDVTRNPLSEASVGASYFADMESIEVVDDYTIRVVWKKKRYFNMASTLALLDIYPRHVFARDEKGIELPLDEAAQLFPQHWYNKRMCGCGPFRFVEFNDNQFIRLERFDSFPGQKPKVDSIMLHIVADADQRLQRFKAGELDVCRMEPAQYRAEYLKGGSGSVKEMIEQGKAELKKWEGATYYYIAWNQRRPIFRDRAVRRALAHAFPKERVARDVYAGLAIPHDGPVHRAESSYLKDLEPFEFDLDKAAKLLDEAGWKPNDQGIRTKAINGRPTELRFNILVVNSRPVYRDFSLLFKKELAKIGVIMELQIREWTQLTKMLNDKSYDAVSLGWGTSWDSDPTQIWHSSQADVPRGSNHCSYRSKVVDEAIAGLETEFELAERKKLWETFQRAIVGDQPYLFLSIPLRPWLINKRCENVFFGRLRPQVWLFPWTIKDPK